MCPLIEINPVYHLILQFSSACFSIFQIIVVFYDCNFTVFFHFHPMFKVIVEDSHKRTMDRFKSGGRETKRVREKDFVKLLPLISNIKKKNEKLTTEICFL